MRIEQPPESSILQAALCAPLVVPVLAIPLAGLLPDMYANGVDMLLKLPFTAFVSLVYGYLGMFLICLPILMLLRRLKALNAGRLCFYTSIFGAAAFSYIFNSHSTDFPVLVVTFAIGACCSLTVCAIFCLLHGITFRSRRMRVPRAA